MGANSATLHESPEQLQPATIDRHRAVASLMEELEAIDWYDQRIDAAQDEQLKLLLAHNRDEEKEHAAMVLEWLRRRDGKLDEHLRTYLFTDLPLLEIEERVEHKAEGPGPDEGCLNIGSLRARTDIDSVLPGRGMGAAAGGRGKPGAGKPAPGGASQDAGSRR